MTGARVPVAWVPREPPLAPVGVAGRGAVAAALAGACRGRAGLVGVAGDGVVVVLGAADALPWVDGCVYLGRDPDGPGLLLPTTTRPDAPLALYARAVLARCPDGAAPVAVLRDPPLLVPLGGARPLDPAWLDRARAPDRP